MAKHDDEDSDEYDAARPAELAERRKRLGIFIRQRRDTLSLSRPQFEARTNIQAGFLANIEAGRTSASLHTIEQIAQGLDIPAAVLMAVYADENSNLRDYLLQSVPLPSVLEQSDIDQIKQYIETVAAAREFANMKKNQNSSAVQKEMQNKKAKALEDVTAIEKQAARMKTEN